MKSATHPLALLGLVVLAVLFGRIIPAWTLSLATVAASKALVALGIVVLARTGNVSFGQGLFYAGGGYGVALIAHHWGLTDAVAQVVIGAVFGACEAFNTVTRAESAPQQAAGMAMAIGCADIPYVAARSVQGIAQAARNERLDREARERGDVPKKASPSDGSAGW